MIEYRVGDVFARLAEIPDGSVDLILTSPPFLALRRYLPADHPDKALEIGSEPDPATFIDTMLRLTAEWRRVLAPHGSICVELGDTYSGSGGAGGDYNDDGIREGQQKFRAVGSSEGLSDHPRQRRSRSSRLGARASRPGETSGHWPLAKSMCGIPTLYTWSLAYGRNLLTGEPSPAGQWRIRNVVAWCRPNPPIGRLSDKFRQATSYLTIACVSSERYFDLDAVRTSPKNGEAGEDLGEGPGVTNSAWRGVTNGGGRARILASHPGGAPPLDYWEISTQGFKGAHYATWPEALLERPILSMTPRTVCLTCGEPSRRITEATHDKEYNNNRRAVSGVGNDSRPDLGASGFQPAQYETIGWTDCGHDNNRTGVVLDPFGGSGTTGVVAQGHGRDCILIDIDERNAQLARDRVGMFLTVVTR